MKEALSAMLKLMNQHGAFQAQIAADVSALKTVVNALGPEAGNALKEQIEIERGKIQEHLKGLEMLTSILNASISNLPN
jgi:hypothetical protein